MSFPSNRAACAALIFLIAAGAAPGQTTSGGSSSDTSSGNDEVVRLNAFEVSSSRDKGYVASESVTGTRIASKIRDIPMVVDVVTADFLKDFAAYDLSQQVGWIPNVSPSDSDGSFILRGFVSTPYVDGFRRLGPLDLIDTARIEVIKGPAASIYGQTLPGGVLNFTSRRPSTRPENRFGLTAGNEGFFRAELSSTGPVGDSKKLFYMTNISTSTRRFEEQWASQQRKSLSMQFMYKPDRDTTINVRFAGQKSHNRDRMAIPWMKGSNVAFLTNNNGKLGMNADGTPLQYTYSSLVYNATTGAYTSKASTSSIPIPSVVVPYNVSAADLAKYRAYIADPSQWGAPLQLSGALPTVSSSWDRLGLEYAKIHSGGPSSYTEYRTVGATVTAERRWSDHINTKATFDVYNRPLVQQSFSGNQLDYANPNYPDGKIGDATPTWNDTYSKGYSGQVDNLFSFSTGPVSHKFLLTYDFTHKADRNWRRTTTNGSIPNAAQGTPNYNLGKYLRVDATDPTLYFPLVIPLGPRSTGTLRWNGTSYSSYPQVLPWPLSDANYFFPSYAAYPSLYTTTTQNTLGASDDHGLFASERATFFKGRLIALIGSRYDYLKNWYKNYASTDPTMIRSVWDEQALTYQMGVTGYATKNIILFANKSTAYNPNLNVGNRRISTPIVDADGNVTGETDVRFESVVMPNERGQGYEFGTRFVLFDQRLNVSLSRFVIDRMNKIDTYTNEFGVSEFVGNGSQRSKGYEATFNWSVTESLQVNGSYGCNDTRYTKNSLAYLVGAPTAQNSKNNYGLVVLYNFREGRLRGLRLTAGMQYYDKSLVSLGSGGLVATNPFSNAFKPLIRNTPLATGVLPIPTLPRDLVILSRNVPTARNDATGAINPANGKVLAVSSSNANKGYVEGVNIPSGWVKYTGQTMDPNTTYYIMDGDGNTAASYQYKTNIDDNRINVYNAPYAIFRVGVGYSFKTGRVTHSVRFNVQNLFDRFYTYGGGVLGFGREYTLAYDLSF